MASRYSAAKNAPGICDRCGQRYKLKTLRNITIKMTKTAIKVCPGCYEPDQPQLKVGMYPVNDPQALREPRPDINYEQSANNAQGSRDFQWGWSPVGGSRGNAITTPNDLVATTYVGTVTITTV